MEIDRKIWSYSVDHLCVICNKYFKSNGALKGHIKSVHEKIKYSCNQCDHQATSQGNLKTHIQSVHEKI